METRQEDSIQQLLLQMRQEHADELCRLEDNREADLRMMRDSFKDFFGKRLGEHEVVKTSQGEERTSVGVWVAAQLLQATGSRTWTHRSLFKLWTHDLLVRLVVSVQRK